MFGIADLGVGSAEFWSEVAARLRTRVPGAQIVGLCASEDSCDAMIDTSDAVTLLDAADPALVHALTAASRDSRVFVFRGRRIIAGITLVADRERLVQQIVAYARQPMVGAAP